jgi:hypothetical protein
VKTVADGSLRDVPLIADRLRTGSPHGDPS